MQTFLFIFRAKAPALIHGKCLHGHWQFRRKIPKPFFFSSTPQNRVLEGSRFQQRHICMCGSHNVFRSSWQSFWVSTAIQLKPFFALKTGLSKCDYEKHHPHSHGTCILLVCRPECGKYPQKWVCKKHKRLTHLRGRACIHACIWKSAPCVK